MFYNPASVADLPCLMKIAVLSDVHGNVPALEAVLEDLARWQPDEVIVNGDLVNRGPLSLDVLQLLQREQPAARLLRGNHENWLLRCHQQGPDLDSVTHEIDRFAHFALRQLDRKVEEIALWDDHLDLTDLEGGSLHITHGSRLGDRHGISPETEGDELLERLGAPRDLFIGSHTHRAFTRSHRGNLVVNTGSVGQPFDHDERAAYVRLQFQQGQWQTESVRIAYDRARAIADFEGSGFLDEGGALTRVILREFIEARVHVGPWRRQYLEAIQAGEITVVASVERYLNNL
jgi:putative phosphoesterase